MTNPSDSNDFNSRKSSLPDYGGEEPSLGGKESETGTGAGSGLPSYGSAAASSAGAEQPKGAHYADHTGHSDDAGYPGYSGYAGAEAGYGTGEKSKLALWTLIIGAASLVATFIPFLSLLSVPLAIAAVIMGIVALVRNRKRPAEERRTWMSIVGMILGIATGVLLIVLGTLVFNVIMNSPEFEECMNKDSQDAIQQCFEDLSKNARDTQNA